MNNIDKDRLDVFLKSIKRAEDQVLSDIRLEALEDDVPIIRDEMADFMRFLMRVIKPKRILEVGCAVGYSGIVMLKEAQEAHLTTIENYEKRIPVAKENFVRAEVSDRVTLLEGDAGEFLGRLEGEFDFIFMDAAKGQYINWLPDVLRLLGHGGVLVTDNVLQEGEILESRYAVARRDRTIHARMREYLRALSDTQGLTTSVVSVGDGAALSIKE
ncbi:MAG: O-methyltransferase [Lachnospiraceae bacterium]|nr:O-methyltransferase [Lachnospiraceae bacterium]